MGRVEDNTDSREIVDPGVIVGVVDAAMAYVAARMRYRRVLRTWTQGISARTYPGGVVMLATDEEEAAFQVLWASTRAVFLTLKTAHGHGDTFLEESA